MQVAVILLVIVTIVGAEERQHHPRLLLVNSRTVTSLHLFTVTLPTIIPVTCWTSDPASPTVSQCTRAARGLRDIPAIGRIDDNINRDELLASITTPLHVESTVAPIPISQDETGSSSSILTIEGPPVDSSEVEVEISGLENCMQGRSALGLTMVYTANSALQVTQYSTTISGSVAFELNGCTPSNFCFSMCS